MCLLLPCSILRVNSEFLDTSVWRPIQLQQRTVKVHSRVVLLLYHLALYANCVGCIKQISHV